MLKTGGRKGNKVKIGGKEIQEEKLLSEGGYAYVYKAVDVATGEHYALKKMICQNDERLKTAKNEINALSALPQHPNLMRFYGSEIIKTDDGWIAYILIEFCEGGSVFDLMMKYEKTKLTEKQILFILREICEGVKVLHSLNPPVIHRDLKIENVLLHNKTFKLCDFGSCSTDQLDLTKIPKSNYFKIEEEFEKNTTLMYRPPEMCDLYQQYPINQKADIWMIGCLLFTMCYYKHPFAEMSKLAIVNASYNFPQEPKHPEKLLDLIRHMLTQDPRMRPDIFELIDILDRYDSISKIELNPMALEMKRKELSDQAETQSYQNAQKKNKTLGGELSAEEIEKLRKRVLKNNEDDALKNWEEIDKISKSVIANPPRKNNSNDWGDWQDGSTVENETKKSDTSGSQPKGSKKDPFSGFGDFDSKDSKSQSNQSERGSSPSWDNFDFDAKGQNLSKPQNSIWSVPQEDSKKKTHDDDDFQEFFSAPDGSLTVHKSLSNDSAKHQADLVETSEIHRFNTTGHKAEKKSSVHLFDLVDAEASNEKVDLTKISF